MHEISEWFCPYETTFQWNFFRFRGEEYVCGENPKDMDKIPALRSCLSTCCPSLSCYQEEKKLVRECSVQIHQRHIIVLVLPLLKTRFMFNVAVLSFNLCKGTTEPTALGRCQLWSAVHTKGEWKGGRAGAGSDTGSVV